jgi:hypothetical protein
MAAWDSRQRADSGVTIKIKWRMDGRWQAESFTDAGENERRRIVTGAIRLPGEGEA